MALALPTQAEADALIAMEKHAIDPHTPLSFPLPGHKVTVHLTSPDERHSFQLDVRRGRIKLTQATYQQRTKDVIVLMRLDLDGPPHTNPNGEEIGCPHLHRYVEGYADKWAIQAPSELLTDPEDLYRVLQDFLRLCNVTVAPNFQRVLL